MDQMENILDGLHILCVDDDPDALELLYIVLARRGARVRTSISGEEAIQVLKNERFDVVVSDLSMTPNFGGYDLVHALRKLERQDPDRPTTPAVAVSADAMKPTNKRRFADFQVYMPKPFDTSRLVRVLDRLAEADGELVKFGSLGLWEAKEAVTAAVVATQVAATATEAASDATAAAMDATSAASEATAAAVDATFAAVKATTAAAQGSIAAESAEKTAATASARAHK